MRIGNARLKFELKAATFLAALVSTFFVVVLVAPQAFTEVLDPNKDYADARDQRLAPGSTGFKTQKIRGGWLESKMDLVKSTVSNIRRQLFKTAGSATTANGEASGGTAVNNRPSNSGLPSAPNRLPAQSSGSSTTSKSSSASFSETVSFPGLSTSESGVLKYELTESVEAIPRLRIPKEPRFASTKFLLDESAKKTLESKFLVALQSPSEISESEIKRLLGLPVVANAIIPERKILIGKGRLEDATLRKLGLILKPYSISPETELKLAKYTPLTDDEFRFLSGLLLYQNGHQCAAAVGLFHSISKKPEWLAEANYFLAMCSKSLGLMTDFSERVQKVFESNSGFYSHRLLKEVDWRTPNVTSRSFGEALLKAMATPEVVNGQTIEVLATAAALIAESSAAAEKFKTALEWSKKVPETHPRFLQSKFVEALAEYQIGSKKRALELQEGLIRNPRAEESAREFQGLIALNLARMYFQEQKYKEAHQAFLTVNKDHPLWLQGLSELGWAQLMAGDYEGAIGNMYSIHSPFFAAAYKPESFVIRTIGYLNLCQYGDAYRTLTVLEREYRTMLSNIDTYEKSIGSFSDGRYGTIKRFLIGFNQPGRIDVKHVDGLPSQVIREIARQKDFLNLQKALNRQIDEKAVYARIGSDIDRSLNEAQAKVTQSRKRVDLLRKNIASIRQKPVLEPNRAPWQSELDSELSRLNDRFFSVDLFNEAKKSVLQYNREVVDGADRRGIEIKKKLESTVANRITKIRTDLSRFMDNNELLRYEVFAASGENIRFQVAGGEKSNRIPATVIPKSKSLQWDFDGEYWEDEIGHYRSSLKNNCPINGDGARRSQASLEGK